MKPRQARRKALIRARMRSGSRWADICILNISARGLGLQCADPPARGTYAEIRRGPHVIIGRVAWSKGRRFGLSTQDALAVQAILREPENPSAAPAPAGTVERRASRRTRLDRQERSRSVSRAMEFGFLILVGIASAAIAFEAVEQALGKPLARVTASLGSS